MTFFYVRVPVIICLLNRMIFCRLSKYLFSINCCHMLVKPEWWWSLSLKRDKRFYKHSIIYFSEFVWVNITQSAFSAKNSHVWQINIPPRTPTEGGGGTITHLEFMSAVFYIFLMRVSRNIIYFIFLYTYLSWTFPHGVSVSPLFPNPALWILGHFSPQ